MTVIKDILQLDLSEDIKNVIDLEDQTESAIQSEIESYIITNGLGNHLSHFIGEYTSNIKETGVWLSGFYGSGKSYFGKMLGYLIDNPSINGTSAIDRFLPRLNGVENQNLIEGDIRKLANIDSQVIFLDSAKQNTDKGLAFTLFKNFLKKLGFRDDKYGYMEFDLFIEDKLEDFRIKAEKELGMSWSEITKGNRNIAKAMRAGHISIGFSEAEYNDTLDLYSDNIQDFSATKFKDELERYLEKFTDQTLVFIFDEASEALSQKKFTLLDLEGISESLSSISQKVWTIAIAQEKLDDVINNTNVSKKDITKVTDRFKTKIHLEATEVDIIIKNRLLLKKEDAHKKLVKFYNEKEGLISDATNLNSAFPTKTENAEDFAIYYPFHKYQFELLQKFLFSSNALVENQIAARGMIITTFDVLRKQLKELKVYGFATTHDICTEAQTSPPPDLVSKFSNAHSIVENANLELNGKRLLKTIHFLSESELAKTTIENITKGYISDIESYYEVKPLIEKALELLIDSKILLVSNNLYKITSDLEGKLLEEMKDITVDLFIKKRELVKYLKQLNIFSQVASISEDSISYNFNIITDADDDIRGSSNKNLKFTVYSLFNVDPDREDFIERIKLDTQNKSGNMTLIPKIDSFQEINQLFTEIRRYQMMEEKYENDDDAIKRQIIREFSIMKNEKEKFLISTIEESYGNGSLIYLMTDNLLNKEEFKTTVNEIQRKLVKNVYLKRLSNQLSENIIPKLLKENDNNKLARFFTGDDFKFFDSKGNFIGESLKVVEEITSRISNYSEGKSIEEQLSNAPWGYNFGTVATTLAVLYRAGKLFVKFNNTEYSSHTNLPSHEAFTSSTKFKSARFKSVSESLSTSEKGEIVQALIDLEFTKYTGENLDWNSSDFDVADATKRLADHFISALEGIKSTQSNFDVYFKDTSESIPILRKYTAKTTEANYIEKAKGFISNKQEYLDAIQKILSTEKFIKKNLLAFNGYERFVEGVQRELSKAGITNHIIQEKSDEFNSIVSTGLVDNYKNVQAAAQGIKDEYFNLMEASTASMKTLYEKLLEKAEEAQQDLKDNFPAELNVDNARDLESSIAFIKSRVVDNVELKFKIECENSGFSLSEIDNYIALAPAKETDIFTIKSGFIKKAVPLPTPGVPKPPKKLTISISNPKMKVQDYRQILQDQVRSMSGMDGNDEVEVSIKN